MAAEPRYEVIEHTADVGVRVRGATMAEVFANAAYGMFDLMSGNEAVRPEVERAVAVDAHDREELMVNWLSELLFVFETERLLLSDFEIAEIDERHVRATVRGERFDPERHASNFDIKAVTYYGLHVIQDDSTWMATVIFDV
ncbi:MAG TPA: archease [Planctomycetota bacterium]|nr:archease [Planctomycetota bacterium]